MTKWTKEKIINLLHTNDKAVGRALMRLYERQTFDEREAKDVKYKNGMGFRPCHARVGVEMAEFFKKQGYLTEKQARYWRVTDRKGNMRIGIYAGQLLKLVA
jgi:hypothetical protein